MDIEVTQDFIDYALHTCTENPIARALNASTGLTCGADEYTIQVNDIQIKAPKSVFRFLDRFFRCSKVEPFTFRLPAYALPKVKKAKRG